MKENNKPNTAENINDEELQNVTGGENETAFFDCAKYNSEEQCLKHMGCMWSSKKNYCYLSLLKPKE